MLLVAETFASGVCSSHRSRALGRPDAKSNVMGPRRNCPPVRGATEVLAGVVLSSLGGVHSRRKRGRWLSSRSGAGVSTSLAAAADDLGSPGGLHAAYMKVLVEEVHYLGEGSAVISLTVCTPSSSAPPAGQFSMLLDAVEVDNFQRGPFLQGEDICDVLVHSGLRESAGESDVDAFAEIALVKPECRVPCSVGEALATSQRLRVPALVSVAYLFQAAKNCVDRALLEECFKEDDENCDLALWGLSYDLGEAKASAFDPEAAEALLQEVHTFACYWRLKHAASRTSHDGEAMLAEHFELDSFGAFREHVTQGSA